MPALDARLLATGIALGRRKLAYSTAQPMLLARGGRQDIAVLTGRSGEPTETALECASEPTVTVLDGAASATTYESRHAAGLNPTSTV